MDELIESPTVTISRRLWQALCVSSVVSHFEYFEVEIDSAVDVGGMRLINHHIKIDTAAGIDYTTDAAQMDQLRQRWAKRMAELKANLNTKGMEL